ncbi:hypothetical protein Acr_06g0016750 [Actinidia rufa]|uniref:Retrotransposon gag domain-containing protein n=1 Tax=Actinidia rufa TaxID=165716 RepID=A0A7J0ETB0_9ERIC|nr:hypothetical protein Acr_06g0016750 [Actinidia rufa]
MSIGKLRMHIIASSCGTVWSPRSMRAWYSWLLPRVCGNEMFSGLDNLHHTYELHQIFFYLTLDNMSLKDYYARFRSVCQKLDLANPVSTDISVMQKRHESMRVARFLSSLLPILTLFVISILVLRNFPP